MKALPVPDTARAFSPPVIAGRDSLTPLLHRTEVAGRNPGDLVDIEIGDDGVHGASAYLHVGRLRIGVDIDQSHDAGAMSETADLFDRVAVAAAQIGTQLRDYATSICDQCEGFGCRTHHDDRDEDCPYCGATGRI